MSPAKLTHRAMQQHTSAVHLDAFLPSPSQFMIIFSTVANQTEHPPTDKWIHARPHASTHAFAVSKSRHAYDTDTHTFQGSSLMAVTW